MQYYYYHLILTLTLFCRGTMYEIILGGNANKECFIRKFENGLKEVATAYTPDILSCIVPRPFWLSWGGKKNRTLAAGKGNIVGSNSVISWTDTGVTQLVGALTFVTGWGTTGNWKFLRDAGKKNLLSMRNKNVIIYLLEMNVETPSDH